MRKDTSLIITTYNWPEALAACLNSILVQTILPKEIIIADDGSGEETKNLIENFIQKNPHIKAIHSWQDDDGYRLAMSRNKAIAKAKGEYIILIDGDIILEKHFIEDHIACREKGYFLQGVRINTTNEMKDRLLNEEIIKFKFFKKGFLNRNRLIRSTFLSKIYSKKINNFKNIEGCNMSFYRKDCIEINGFEENLTGWGCEDKEFAARFLNLGLKVKKIKHRAIVYHLFHKERDKSNLSKHFEILNTVVQNKKTRAEEGIDKYLAKG